MIKIYRENIVQFYRDINFQENIIKETIIPITRCDLGYFISDYGNVYSIRNKKLKQLTPTPSNTNHLLVNLPYKGKYKSAKIHQLVLEAFVGKRPKNSSLVRHLNGIPSDNRLVNLAYGTYLENGSDTILHGVTVKGERNGKHKLKQEEVLKIRKLYKTGEYTHEKLGDMFGISRRQIGDIINKINWGWLQDEETIVI